MKTNTQIAYEGFSTLFNNMDILDAERFITILLREKFDYTKWRQDLFEDLSIEEISQRAMDYIKSKNNI